MARPLRVEYPGAFYHVLNRGNAGEDIFLSDRDREKFLKYLEKAVERYGIRIHTYCLMTNHYHLIVETPEPNLSQSIKWINVSYATYFNRKRSRKGHLFQGRYKSIIVDADEYLKPLSRYIHLNPARAGIVENLESYSWSSYPAFIGKRKSEKWLVTDRLLSLFDKNRKISLKKYKRYVTGISPFEIKNPHQDVVGGLILGEAQFVEWIKETFMFRQTSVNEIPQLNVLKTRVDVDTIVKKVSEAFKCDPEIILRKGRKRNLPRDIAIYLSRDVTGKTGVVLGNAFGGISGAGITVRYKVMEKKLNQDKRLKGRINRLKKQIINN